MKKKDIILFLIVILVIIVPDFVNALTKEEVYLKIDELPFKIMDGKRYFDTKIVDLDIITKDECLYTLDDYNKNYNLDITRVDIFCWEVRGFIVFIDVISIKSIC